MSNCNIKFTEKQLRAIKAMGKDVLVSAAAGSGKTAVLTERVVGLVQKGVPIEKMLIVTYTKAAAASMRRRIADWLASSGMGLAARNVSPANICTIHSFCSTLLREFFVEAGISPSFRVQDEAKGHRMRESAMDESLEKMLEYEGFIDTIAVFGGVKNIKEYAHSLYKFLISRPDPIQWLDDLLFSFCKNAGDIERSEWAKDAIDEARKSTLRAAGMIDEAYGIFDDDSAREVLHSDAQIALNIIDCAERGYGPLSNYRPSFKRWSVTKGSRKDNPPEMEAAKSLRDAAKELLLEAAQLPPLIVARENDSTMAVHLGRLCDMVKEFERSYFAMKAESEELDFSDLEHFALAALKNEDVSEKMRHRFEHVFIDEYQDANALQEEILKHITRGNNLFMVGDVKQSIYGFRMAEPSLFTGKYNSFSKEGNEKGELISMNDNYRSCKAVIDCVNRVFEKAMSPEMGGIAYDDDARLQPGNELSADDPHRASLQVLVMADAKAEMEEDEELRELLEDFSTKKAESRLIIDNIIALLGKMMEIDGVYRPVELRDIAILLRSPKGWVATVTEMLRQAEIPFVTDSSEGYYSLTEVKALVNLLSVIENRHQDIPLVGALTAPFTEMMFMPEEIAHIRAAFPDRDMPFYKACMSYAESIDDSVGKRMRFFFDSVEKWRAQSRKMPAYSLILLVMEETGYYDFVGALPHGGARQENLRALVNRAKAYDSLGEFLSVATLGDEGSGEGANFSAAPENEQAVQIMSIHKSKGLEFPVVIVAGTGGRINLQDTTGPLIFHREKGFGMKHVDPDLLVSQAGLSHMSVSKAIINDSLAEELRVLYVAMTRAKERLIITGCVQNRESAESKWNQMADSGDFSGARSLLDFIAPSFGEEKYVSLSTEKVEKGFAENGKGAASVNFSWIDERLDWRYQHGRAAQPEKISATALSRYEMPVPPRPQFAQEKKGLTGAERGTALHTVLSALKKTRLYGLSSGETLAGITRQLEEMLERGLISNSQAEAVRPDGLAAFFLSDIGQRALSARELLCEQPFNILISPGEAGVFSGSDDKILLQGIIDMCFLQDDEWIIIDFKSGWLSAQRAKESYSDQLKLYALALRRLTGKGTKPFIYMLDTQMTIPV
ncbi:MAG: UvrD-helicase domain-containing protein [Christensenellales bacterium]